MRRAKVGQKNVRIYKNDEFFDLKIAKLPPPTSESAKSSPDKQATSSAPTRKRTGQNAEEKTAADKSATNTENHHFRSKEVRDH
uniref:Uncharacterized protein n=1 Tax=Ditylenchus dipsaci TaxID=166011 RepID=A0A915DVU9_9BILA